MQATVALRMEAYRLSKHTTQQALEEIFGVPMSVATVSQLEQAITATFVSVCSGSTRCSGPVSTPRQRSEGANGGVISDSTT